MGGENVAPGKNCGPPSQKNNSCEIHHLIASFGLQKQAISNQKPGGFNHLGWGVDMPPPKRYTTALFMSFKKKSAPNNGSHKNTKAPVYCLAMQKLKSDLGKVLFNSVFRVILTLLFKLHCQTTEARSYTKECEALTQFPR